MTTTELTSEITKFKDECANRGKPLSLCALVPNVMGSYNILVYADWMDGVWDTISFLTDVLFDVTSVDARQAIFTIEIYKPQEQPPKPIVIVNEIGYVPDESIRLA